MPSLTADVDERADADPGLAAVACSTRRRAARSTRAAPSRPKVERVAHRGARARGRCARRASGVAVPPAGRAAAAHLHRRDPAPAGLGDDACRTRHDGRQTRPDARSAATGRPAEPLLEVEGLTKHFPVTGRLPDPPHVGAVQAVDGVDFDVRAGREPRPGRRVRLRQVHHRPAAGPAAGADRRARSRSRGQDITHASRSAAGAVRSEIQMIFQDPYSSLNPRQTVGRSSPCPMEVNGINPPGGREKRVRELLETRRPQPRALQPLPARVLRRPAPAHRRRPGAGPASRS